MLIFWKPAKDWQKTIFYDGWMKTRKRQVDHQQLLEYQQKTGKKKPQIFPKVYKLSANDD